MRPAGDAGDQIQVSGDLEEIPAILGRQPGSVVILGKVVREALDRPFARRFLQPLRRARRVVGVRPRTVDVGVLVQAVRIAADGLGDVVGVRLRVDPAGMASRTRSMAAGDSFPSAPRPNITVPISTPRIPASRYRASASAMPGYCSGGM